MARKINERPRNPYIVVFWEGESEEVYMKFMRQKFHNCANVEVNRKKGLFHAAVKAFKPKGELYHARDVVDEIWFVFDTEDDIRGKWEEYVQIIKKLSRMNDYIKIRLLMTKGCIEYYFLLHYEKSSPTIQTPADKSNIEEELRKKYSACYRKGDKDSIYAIAENYKTAIENGKWCLKRLENEIGDLNASLERDRKLFCSDRTFSNVYEGIECLEKLQENKRQSR